MGCHKKGWPSKRDAKRALRRLLARTGWAVQVEGARFMVYRCRECALPTWHHGHSDRRRVA